MCYIAVQNTNYYMAEIRKYQTETRTVSKFLWLPKRIDGRTKWLCYATWEEFRVQIYKFNWVNPIFGEHIAWVDGTLQNGFDMADITKCTGDHCPIKDKCYRHTAPSSEWQTWFVETPGKYEDVVDGGGKLVSIRWTCDMYWGEQQDAIMDTLTNIFQGQ